MCIRDRVNNIERQVKLLAHKTVEIVEEADSSKRLLFSSGDKSIRLRDFYEYYIDEQPLINIISKCYWNIEADEKSEFFNSKIGCLGGFGLFWDQINVAILTKKEFTSAQIKSLVDLYKPKNSSSIDCTTCLLYTSPSPRDRTRSRMPSSA